MPFDVYGQNLVGAFHESCNALVPRNVDRVPVTIDFNKRTLPGGKKQNRMSLLQPCQRLARSFRTISGAGAVAGVHEDRVDSQIGNPLKRRRQHDLQVRSNPRHDCGNSNPVNSVQRMVGNGKKGTFTRDALSNVCPCVDVKSKPVSDFLKVVNIAVIGGDAAKDFFCLANPVWELPQRSDCRESHPKIRN